MLLCSVWASFAAVPLPTAESLQPSEAEQTFMKSQAFRSKCLRVKH